MSDTQPYFSREPRKIRVSRFLILKKTISVSGYLHRTESQFFVAPHLLQTGAPFTIAMLWFWLQLLFENTVGRPVLPHFLQVIFPVIMAMSWCPWHVVEPDPPARPHFLHMIRPA
jgi:hypothetical protein